MEKDKLTGLLLFDDFISVAKDRAEKSDKAGVLAVISVDFSKFKYINHVYGYESGDMLISKLAKMFVSQESCLVACRPYSDHIVGLFAFDESQWEIKKNELKILEEAFVNEYRTLFPKTSIHLNVGVYIMDDHSEDIASAIDKANIARRSVKGNYSVPFALYTKKIQKKKDDESRLIPIFEKAIEENAILVYMQPKYNVSENEVQGAEALTRLMDEDGKLIPPDDFIPVLEDSGKVLELDWYVMRYVFAKVKEWLAQGKKVVPISVNLSKLHFYYDNLVNDIINEFDTYEIDPKYIEFEVTESVFFEEAELIISKIEKLREHGFKVSVDDFGAGYSSLNLIGILPVDTIKLDKGFIKNSLGNRKGMEIMKGLIQILNEIDMEIVCEGIETTEEEKVVYEYGCDHMQGFLYDRPIPVYDFEKKYM